MRRLMAALALLAVAQAASAEDAPICADRPAKANGTCTVPTGLWQIELGMFDQLDYGGDNSALNLGQLLVKYGLTDRSDIEAAFTPYVRVKADGERISEPGDLVLRYKHRVTPDDAPVAVTLLPFVKLPTAKDSIGNGRVEGGVAAPISFALKGPLTMTLGPEVDRLADADGHGRHAQVVQLVNVGAAVTPRLTLTAEWWGAWNADPAGTVRQSSADVAASFAATDNLAFDAGANFGLKRATADMEIYAGISARF